MTKWMHPTEGHAIHCLPPNQTCTCSAQHVSKEAPMDSKHTPTPWEIAQFGDGGDGFIGHQIWNRAGGEVCIVRIAVNQHHDAQYADFVARCEANAEFIVRAANNFYPMLTALQAWSRYFKTFPDVAETDRLKVLVTQNDEALRGAK